MVIRDKNRVGRLLTSAQSRGKGIEYTFPVVGRCRVFVVDGNALIFPVGSRSGCLCVDWLQFCRFKRRREKRQHWGTLGNSLHPPDYVGKSLRNEYGTELTIRQPSAEFVCYLDGIRIGETRDVLAVANWLNSKGAEPVTV